MFNEPAVGEKFFGRDRILELLSRRAAALKDGYRQNVALTGQSLAGKSSIIFHFLHTIKEEGFVPVYVEVVREPFRNFANKFIATMLYNALTRIGEQADTRIDSLMEKAAKRLPKTVAGIKAVNALIERSDLDEAYLGLLGLTSLLKEEISLSCIVMLDEFDNLESLGIKNPFLGFGKVIMVQKDTMYIVSSSRNEAIKKIISEKLSLLFGNFEVVNVSNFDLATANAFLDSRLAGLEIDADLRRFLLAFTDGNPFYLDKIAAGSKEAAIEKMRSFIEKDDIVNTVLELIYNSGGSIHQYLLNYILELLDARSKDTMLGILCAIADGNTMKAGIARSLRIKQTDAAKGASRLVELGLVLRSGAFYSLNDVVLEFWLKHVYQRRKALLVDGAVDRMVTFKAEMAGYMSEYMRELERPVVSRVAELFNAFSNELIPVESRNIRLPHFTRVDIREPEGSKPFIAASFRGNYWIAQVYESCVNENDIINYIRDIKAAGFKVLHKIIIPLKGIDENAMLLAKELKISIWENQMLNLLMKVYGKKRVIIL